MPRWALALILAAGIGLLYAGYHINQTTRKPNVVFLVLDTLRYDRFAGERNGKPVMPFLNEFAKGGARFDAAISPASWTRPALAALLTGTYPDTNRVRFGFQMIDGKKVSDTLAPGFETMPEMLAAAGYDNWAFQTNHNVHPDFGFAQGFEDGRYDFTGFQRAEQLTDRVLLKLGEMKPPFFTFVQYIDPHAPFDPVEEYRNVFGPQPEPSEEDKPHIDRGPEEWRLYFEDDTKSWLGTLPQRQFKPLSESGREAIRYRYDAECRYLDDQLARLIRTIEGQYPNTLFVVVSDHGDEFWERGTCGHGQHVYQELIHVPLIIKGPNVPVGKYAETVGTLGIFPTVAKLLGLAAISQWQVPDMFTQVANPAPVYSWTKGPRNDGVINAESITIGQDKLIDDKSTSRAGTSRYDLAADPGETKNLYPTTVESDSKLLGALERHRETASQAAGSVQKATVALSPEMQKQLGDLGYAVEDPAKNGGDAPSAEAAPEPASAVPNTQEIAPSAARMEQLEALGYLGGEEEKKKP